MGKTINLLPPSVKHERKMKTAKQSVVYFIVACAGSTVFFNWYEKHLQKQISNYENQISTYDGQQTQADSLQKKIDLTIEQKESISTSSFPYHRFLYFVMTNATEDTRILSVQSISPNTISKKQASEQVGEDGQPITDPSQAQTQPAADANQGGVQPATDAGTDQTQASTDATANADTTAQDTSSPVPGDGTATSATNGETTNTTATSPVVEKSPFIFDTSEIYIRGYTIYPDSIAKLANKIKQEEYISNVTVTKVRDYYTGLKNFKLFEMKITYK